jgi:hypothetical protein
VSLSKDEEKRSAWPKNGSPNPNPESPAWHGEILAKADAGDAKFLTIAELKKRLRR